MFCYLRLFVAGGLMAPGHIDMHHGRTRIDCLERGDGLLDTVSKLDHHSNVAAVALQVWRPPAALAAHPGIHHRLIQRRVPAYQVAIALGERGGIGCDQLRIGRVVELAVEPERAAVVHQIDDWCDTEIADDIGYHRIGPTPVELALPRLDAIPWHAPADRLNPQRAPER